MMPAHVMDPARDAALAASSATASAGIRTNTFGPGDQGWRQAMEKAQMAQWFHGALVQGVQAGQPAATTEAVNVKRHVGITGAAGTLVGPVQAGFLRPAAATLHPVIRDRAWTPHAGNSPSDGETNALHLPSTDADSNPVSGPGANEEPLGPALLSRLCAIGLACISVPGETDLPAAVASPSAPSQTGTLVHSSLIDDRSARHRHLHIECRDGQAQVWLGMQDKAVRAQHHELALIDSLRLVLARRGLTLTRLVCNGRQLYSRVSTLFSREA